MATVVGAFETREGATRAVDQVIAGGFDPGDVSVLGRGGEPTDVTPENETATSVAAGAGIGAAIGGFGALLVGAAALAVPGVGPLLAFGPFAAAFSTALMGGLAGGLIGFLISQGVPAEEADFYAERVRAGAYLVAVHCDTAEETRARTILANAGAEAPIRRTA